MAVCESRSSTFWTFSFASEPRWIDFYNDVLACECGVESDPAKKTETFAGNQHTTYSEDSETSTSTGTKRLASRVRTLARTKFSLRVIQPRGANQSRPGRLIIVTITMTSPDDRGEVYCWPDVYQFRSRHHLESSHSALPGQIKQRRITSF